MRVSARLWSSGASPESAISVVCGSLTRCSYLTNPEIRALAAAHADRRIGWDELILADRAALDAHQRTKREPAR